MVKKLSHNTSFIYLGLLGFSLAFYLDRAWPVVFVFVITGLYVLYLLLLAPHEDNYTFKEEVTPLFTQHGYEILNERPLNFPERMNRAPEIKINPGFPIIREDI